MGSFSFTLVPFGSSYFPSEPLLYLGIIQSSHIHKPESLASHLRTSALFYKLLRKNSLEGVVLFYKESVLAYFD